MDTTGVGASVTSPLGGPMHTPDIHPQGALPQREGMPEIYVALYSISLALGFGMLFISIIVSMVCAWAWGQLVSNPKHAINKQTNPRKHDPQAISKRMCKYMYNRARNHRVNFGSVSTA